MTETGKITSAQALKLTHGGVGRKETAASSEFAAHFKEKQYLTGKVQFSRHAVQRMEQRGVRLSEDTMDDLSRAVERARAKGSRDAVVIGSGGAFIVNVPNNIVVTTITEQEMKQNIFTNIDSAVFM